MHLCIMLHCQRFVTLHAKMVEDAQRQADVNVPVVQEACIVGTFAKHVSYITTQQQIKT